MPLFIYPNPTDTGYCVISENPAFGVFEMGPDGFTEEALACPFEEIPRLIIDLKRAYFAWKISQDQSDADGAILLPAAPGDFS